jgi:predicted AlkP superfamily pyrophosphatase or phosphodiesterase
MRIRMFLVGAAILFMTFGAFAAERPALVVQITVDQLRGDMPFTFSDRFGVGGFLHFMNRGMVFSNAHYAHASTFTASGHATVVTGGHPAQHGMIANGWFDRERGVPMYAVGDTDHRLWNGKLGQGIGASPANLLSSTIGDELVNATEGRARVFSVAVKDRASVILGGHKGKAFWYDSSSGEFTSSSYYYPSAPDWVRAWNDRGVADNYRGKQWDLLLNPASYSRLDQDDRSWELGFAHLGRIFPHPLDAEDDKLFYSGLRYTPFGDAITLDFAKHVIKTQNLGQGEETDMLLVSLSCTDLVGHVFGPNSLEAEDNLIRLDRFLADFLDFVDRHVGLDRTLLVLTADHGIPPIPRADEATQATANRVPTDVVRKCAEAQLDERYGEGADLIQNVTKPYVYMDFAELDRRGLDRDEVSRFLAAALAEIEGIAYAVPRGAITTGDLPDSPIMNRVRNAFHDDRSGDIYLVQDPYWYLEARTKSATTHGSPYPYDTYVPIMFAGPGIPQGECLRATAPHEIAPTLAALLRTVPPSGCMGEALEAIVANL